MTHTVRSLLMLALFCGSLLLCAPPLTAQQTLGGITGTVSDKTGSVLPETAITIVEDQTQLTRSQQTNANGSYDFVNLPIGTYTLTFTHAGFETQKIPSILVQANRTVTVNATLQIGQVGQVVTVEESPLINAVDTTNGYILEKQQIDSIPLPTGSFTGLAILSPGVNAELPGGTGANAGLGNQPIWANGQRDTSNTFLVNGVDAANLFNGKTTSQVTSARLVNNTGIGGSSSISSTTAEVLQSSASPYLAIGEAIPTPPQETIQELRVNTSMYDAQQGSTSGAHIDMSTASGTNKLHGGLYGHRGTDWLNAAPFFFNQDSNIPANEKVPALHRYDAGGTLGGALIKDKLFVFLSYEHTHVGDGEIGTSRVAVPFGLTNNNRTAQGLADIANANWGTSLAAADVNPVALALFQYKLPNGQYMVPSDDGVTPTINFPENAFVQSTAYFIADRAVSDVDWTVSPKDSLAFKYYYQNDPTKAPFAYSSVLGFTQHLAAGSQVATITNTQSLRPNFNVQETFGFIRERIYSNVAQPFTPQQLGINAFGSSIFPGITIVDDIGNDSPNNTNFVANAPLLFGEGSNSQAAFTGVFQNRFMPSVNAIWNRGKHTITFGSNFSYTQLNTLDHRTNSGMVGVADFSQFLQGLVTPDYSVFVATAFLQGNANRYYRAKQSGDYIQDKYQIRSNLSLTAGLRFDWNGGLTEKYGRIFNFDPSNYSYDETTGDVTSNGFIIAGNNAQFPTKGVSDTTLTGRQWGLAPRVGLAWSPKMFENKIVVRAGWGMYYDRGELFSYLSPGFAAGIVTGGPFGVNQAPPFVNAQRCTATIAPYQDFIQTCDPNSPNGGSLSAPWGAALGPAPTGNPADISQYLPTRDEIEAGAPLFAFADYNRANKLPYTMNQTLDIQWQPRNDLAIDIGYVGNLGRHEVIPIPFNQAGIASPSHPIHGQEYTYGYTVVDPNFNGIALPNGQGNMLATYEGGNVDMRVPYIGYSSESESYTAAGISAYHALQAHVEKRLSHNVQVGFSYTYSHATDEQSAMGLFYNGNNPLDLRSGYGSADFDRTHVVNFDYVFQLPKLAHGSSLTSKFVNGWAMQGITVIQSGQPYSVIDYSGAVGSIFYGTSNGITNPIVPLAAGCTPKKALTGGSGAFGGSDVALNAACFTLPLLKPGDLGGAIPPGDIYETNFTTGQRNIFRQGWQRRADISLVKSTKLTERVTMKYTFDVFNVTNTASFDIPVDNISQNLFFNDFPAEGQPALPTSCSISGNTALYFCPQLGGLGVVNKTIGSPRQVQMSLSFVF